ncbi:maleylpyruvate isomerase family mycothiol-dependent enzyme [Amycolatopsis methanolica]|uniref:Mycothiol-dependent maleylpyruvate isomerase metal-binding domain-containing protein n=1 Tax=Amycolatopsis methanolica 239 TaxID=1068978 RepID=A0A076MJY6_AMYME|nr:maleylpyruvate isomerase family mycothiol-dependent enzyme [Amycolatopsis methanolica]AIJ21138.1 hypothetical protein AMETH_1046 [Amycolatopsis methanolica 239]
MDFDRHCIEIVTQTELLTADTAGADLRAPVPSCPGWTLGMLLRHIGGGHRWAEEIVRTRSLEYLPDDQLRKLDGDDTGDVPAHWLLEGARRLAETLRAAGPDAPAWAPFDFGRAAFLARRFAFETVVHRADACLAAGAEFTVADDVAGAAIDEWMELDVLPQHFETDPRKRELLGPARTIAWRAPEASWFVDLTGDVIRWRRGPAGAAVTVCGSLTDLLLLVYRRRPPEGLTVTGDASLLGFWLDHVAFG